MIIDCDNKVTEQVLDQCPLIAKNFLKYGFTFYQSSYDKPHSGWIYRDKNGCDNLLTPEKSDLEQYEYCYKGKIYFPQYLDTPQLMIPNPNHHCIEVKVYNESQLKLFVELIEQAAELRTDIKRQSDEIKKTIHDKFWKG